MSKFVKDASVTFINQILVILMSLVSAGIVARSLGPEGRGIYSLALLLPGIPVILTQFGIGGASIYYLGRRKYDTKEVLGNNILYTVLLSLLGIFVGLAIIIFFSDKIFFGVDKKYLFLCLFFIPFNHFSNFVLNILLGLNKVQKYNLILFLQNCFFFILIILAVFFLKLGIGTALLAQLLAFLLSSIILFFLVKEEAGGISLKFNKSYLEDILSYGSKGYLMNMFDFLQSSLAMFIMNIFMGPIAVGFYSISQSLCAKILLFSQSVSTVIYPKVSSENDPKRIKEFTPMVCRITMLITLIGAFFVFIFARWLILIVFSDSFLPSVEVFRILVFGVVPMSVAVILINDIAGRGKPKVNAYIYGINMALSLLVYFILIHSYGLTGAAFATLFSSCLFFLLTIFSYMRISGNKLLDIIFVKKSDFEIIKFYILKLSFLKNKKDQLF